MLLSNYVTRYALRYCLVGPCTFWGGLVENLLSFCFTLTLCGLCSWCSWSLICASPIYCTEFECILETHHILYRLNKSFSKRSFGNYFDVDPLREDYSEEFCIWRDTGELRWLSLGQRVANARWRKMFSAIKTDGSMRFSSRQVQLLADTFPAQFYWSSYGWPWSDDCRSTLRLCYATIKAIFFWKRNLNIW